MIAYEKNHKYILACSFGPDSMALFQMLLEEKFDFVVAHVNYHKREASIEEERRLRLFCKEHDIAIRVLDTRDLKCNGNFQAWAREVRYDFFKSLCEEYNAAGVFVAHHRDDVIETFLMQKQRFVVLDYYGIAAETKIKNMLVMRPLIACSKAELEDYCLNYQVPYAIDESNFTDDYTRNKIRHQCVDKIDDCDKMIIQMKIEFDNKKMANQRNIITDFLQDKKMLHCSELLEFEESLALQILRAFFIRETGIASSIAQRIEVYKAMKSIKPNIQVKLSAEYIVVKEYDLLKISVLDEFNGYKYIVESPQKLETHCYSLNLTDSNLLVNIPKEKYPLTIRTFEAKDAMKTGDITKKISRLFIDWKMPTFLRKRWPIILDKEGIIIYVPRYRSCYISTQSNNLFIK